MEDITYDLDTLPDDAEIFVGQTKEYEPIDPSEMYQIEVVKAELRNNPWHKPDAPDPKDRGSKYQLGFEFIILNEGEFYGRRLWDNTSPAFKPAGARDATKLYKIVSKVLDREFDLQECFEYAPDMKTFVTNLHEEIIGKQLKVAIENSTNANTGKIRTKISTYNTTKEELPTYDPDKARQMQAEADRAVAEKKEDGADDVDDFDIDEMLKDDVPEESKEKPEKKAKKEDKAEAKAEKKEAKADKDGDEIPF